MHLAPPYARRGAPPVTVATGRGLENAFITVGVGLAGEITRIANALGIAASDVCDAAATKTTRYLAFHPGPGVGGHCLPNDLRMLAATSRELGWPAPLLAGAAAVTAAQPGWVVDRLEQLARAGGGLAGREVLVVGVGFKIGTADTTEAPAREVVRVLRARGARPVFVDALVHELVVDGEPVPRIDAAALAPGRFAAGVVLSGDPTVGVDRLRAAVGALLDASGGRALEATPGTSRL